MRALPKDLSHIVSERENIFRLDCFDPRLKTDKLKGRLHGYWSFSLTPAERVLFEFIDDDSVGFIDVGDHSIYQ